MVVLVTMVSCILEIFVDGEGKRYDFGLETCKSQRIFKSSYSGHTQKSVFYHFSQIEEVLNIICDLEESQ